MRNKAITRDFYLNVLEFQDFGSTNYDNYLMLEKDRIQIHFFKFEDLDPNANYGQVYIRIDDIDAYYKHLLGKMVSIHPNGNLQTKPWGQREFSILDPDNNLLTFGQSIWNLYSVFKVIMNDKKVISTIDNYIASFPKEVQTQLKKIRSIILERAPDAVESISYGMLAYKTKGKPLVYFAAFKNHIGLYATPSGHTQFAEELSIYKTV